MTYHAKYFAARTPPEKTEASIRRLVCRISSIYRLNRHPDSTKDPDVTIEMRRMYQNWSAPQYKQAALMPTLEKLLFATEDSIRGIRD